MEHLLELKEKFKKHDYPVNIITDSIKNVLEIPPNELWEPKEKQKDEVLLFISTFNPNN